MNPWKNLNPPVTLSKMLSEPRAENLKNRMERETPRPVMGMLPRALRFQSDGLSVDPSLFPLPVELHLPALPAREAEQVSLSAPAEEIASKSPALPRVQIENFRLLERGPLLAPSVHDAASARSRVEALNGRLIVRSKIDVGQHSCRFDTLGTQDLAVELRRQALTRDLVVLENSVRGVEQEGLSRLTEASVQLAGAKTFNIPVGVRPAKASGRVVGPRLRFSLPEVEQPR